MQSSVSNVGSCKPTSMESHVLPGVLLCWVQGRRRGRVHREETAWGEGSFCTRSTVRACVRRVAKSISEGQRGMGVRRIHRGVWSRKYYLRYPSETIVIAAATAYACISITFIFRVLNKVVGQHAEIIVRTFSGFRRRPALAEKAHHFAGTANQDVACSPSMA